MRKMGFAAVVLLGLGLVGWPGVSEAGHGKKGDPCCKHCNKGKACGNTCIPAKKQCNSPPGCACNG